MLCLCAVFRLLMVVRYELNPVYIEASATNNWPLKRYPVRDSSSQQTHVVCGQLAPVASLVGDSAVYVVDCSTFVHDVY